MSDVFYSVNLRVEKDFLSNSVSVNATATMSQVGMSSVIMSLGSSPANISTASLTSVGVAFLRNLSTATASVCTVGIEAGGSFVGFCALRAGEPAMLRLASGTNYKAVGTPGARLRVDITEG